jgi:hypothetical protein
MAKYTSLKRGGFAVFALHAYCASAQNATCGSDDDDDEIKGNLDIATPCRLANIEIDGNVTLFAGGSLVANDVRIRGNLEARRADFIDLQQSRVEGSVRLEELVGDLTSLEQTNVRGDVVLARNRSRLEVLNNDLRGSIQATGNSGGVLISGNAIDGSLECSGNSPAPVGLGNRVDGGAQGQCVNLRPESTASSSSPPPPTTTTPPPTTTQPAATTAPPTTTTPTATATPPATTTPPPTTGTTPAPTTSTLVEEDLGGGAGAIGWPVALLLPLLWRRRKTARAHARAAIR